MQFAQEINTDSFFSSFVDYSTLYIYPRLSETSLPLSTLWGYSTVKQIETKRSSFTMVQGLQLTKLSLPDHGASLYTEAKEINLPTVLPIICPNRRVLPFYRLAPHNLRDLMVPFLHGKCTSINTQLEEYFKPRVQSLSQLYLTKYIFLG